MKKVFWLAIVALVSACGGDDAACEDGAYQCDGDVSQVCTDGAWEDAEDCVAEDMGTCDPGTGMCDMGSA